MTNKIRVTSLNFDDIKSSLVSYLQSQTEFTDMNFSASGISTIVDLLSANAHYQALMANFLANEVYMDTAVKRSSIVSRAKELGYIPYSKKSARATINVIASITTSPPTTLVIPANSQFQTTINNSTFTFVTLQSYAAPRNPQNNTYTFTGIELFEGAYIQKKFIVNGVDPTYEIPNQDIDTSTIRLFVQDPTSGDQIEYILAQNLVDVSESSEVFFIQEGYNGNYEFYFGDGVIGNKPLTGATVTAFFVATSGATGNDAQNFTLSSSITGFENASVSCITTSIAAGGRAQETIQSIKMNAMNQFGVQNRAVVASDYKSIVLSSGVNVKSVHVWGGEDNVPPKYGYIIVCAQPAIGDYLLEAQKIVIKELLKKKAVANINIEFQDPEYLDIIIDTKVVYNKNTLDVSTYDLEVDVLASIVTYALENVNMFDATFRYSNMMKEIDRTNNAVLSNITTFKLQKEITPILYQKQDYIFSFNNSLNNGLKSAAVYSSSFRVSDIPQNVYIEDNGNSLLNLYATIDNKKTLVKENIGTVNYTTGDVKMTNMTVVSYDGGSLDIIGVPVSNDIHGTNNVILRIQSANVTVSSKAE